jgi:hypothetical protein
MSDTAVERRVGVDAAMTGSFLESHHRPAGQRPLGAHPQPTLGAHLHYLAYGSMEQRSGISPPPATPGRRCSTAIWLPTPTGLTSSATCSPTTVLANSLDQVHEIAASQGLVASLPSASQHEKDVRLDRVVFRPLGRGSLDFADILAAINEVGYDSWLLVELDSYDGAPLEAAKSARSISSKSSTSFPDPRSAGVYPSRGRGNAQEMRER